MSDDSQKPPHAPVPVQGTSESARYTGPTALAPYPMSRLAPSFELVNLAKEIEKADAQVAIMTGGKLLVIAEQIRALQDKAHQLLKKADDDAQLHRALCRFEKKPGDVYHLYGKDDGSTWFSIIAPNEWRVHKPKFLGSFRLEADMSFTPLEKVTDVDAQQAGIRALLGSNGPRG
jgi:hypothetical protein